VDIATSRRRLALFALFLNAGLSFASWAARTPDIRDLLGASTAEMGLVLFGLSAGSMAGVLSSGAMVTRFGARTVITAGALAIVASMPVVGLGGALSSPLLVACGLALLGLGLGGAEVAMNVEGADVEQVIGRSVLPTLHGCWSLGTVVGGAAGMALSAARVPVLAHLVAVSAVGLAVVLWGVRQLPAATGKRSRTTAGVPEAGSAVWRNRMLLVIGLIVLAMALAEGAANDWLPLIMVDGFGLAPAIGSGFFVAFSAAMTVGRFTGSFFLDRFGRAAVLCAGAIVSGIGIALVVAVDNAVVAGVAALLWGRGTSLGFPVAVSAAADAGDRPTAQVSLVAMVAYLAFLAGPPGLGALGERFGLRSAMILVLAFVAMAALLAPTLRTRTPAARPAVPSV
jgi:fucose permease